MEDRVCHMSSLLPDMWKTFISCFYSGPFRRVRKCLKGLKAQQSLYVSKSVGHWTTKGRYWAARAAKKQPFKFPIHQQFSVIVLAPMCWIKTFQTISDGTWIFSRLGSISGVSLQYTGTVFKGCLPFTLRKDSFKLWRKTRKKTAFHILCYHIITFEKNTL